MLSEEAAAGTVSVMPGRQSIPSQAATDKPDSTYATVSEVEFLFQKIAAIAEKLDLKKNVVRVWFCTQRQKQKRMKFASAGQGQGGPGSGL